MLTYVTTNISFKLYRPKKLSSSLLYSGMALGVILHKFKPDLIDLNKLNTRTAKSNLKIILDSYKQVGLDLYAIININEMSR